MLYSCMHTIMENLFKFCVKIQMIYVIEQSLFSNRAVCRILKLAANLTILFAVLTIKQLYRIFLSNNYPFESKV